MIRPKKPSMATPMQISGTTIGIVTMPSNSPCPGKRARHSASAAIAPSTTLMIVDRAAIVSELAKAPSSASSPASRAYQSSVKPSQRIVRRDASKLNSTRLASGT